MAKNRRRVLRKAPVLVLDPDPADLGPCMLALTEHQRRFVVAYAMNGNGYAAALSAGYKDSSDAAKVVACRMLQNDKIIAALKEWTERLLFGNGAYVAVSALIEIASDSEHKRRFEAADSLADRVGFARQTNHQVSVEHVDSRSTGDLLEAIGRYVEAKRAVAPRIKGPVDATVDVQHTVGHETAPSTEPEKVKKKQTDQGVGV